MPANYQRRRVQSFQQRLVRNIQNHWPLEAASVRNAIWGSSGPLDLTAVNTPTSVAGPSNNLPLAAGLAAASSQAFTRASAQSIQMGLRARGFTAAIWAYAATLPGTVMGIFGEDGGGVLRNWRLVVNATNMPQAFVYDGANVMAAQAGAVISATTWYFLVFRATSRRVDLFVNGVLDTTFSSNITWTAEWGSAVQAMSIGNDVVAAGRFWNGRFVPATFWSRPISDAEAFGLWNNAQGYDLRRAA